jgi:hypothetical protein
MLFHIEDKAYHDDRKEQKAPCIISLASLGNEDQGFSVKMPRFFQYASQLFHINFYASKK